MVTFIISNSLILASVFYVLSCILFATGFAAAVLVTGKTTVGDYIAGAILMLLPVVNFATALWIWGHAIYHIDVIVIRNRP